MHADKKHVIRLLNTSKGQIEGIIKMIEDDRYCIDIWNIFNRYMIENYTEKLGYNLKNLI